MDVVIASEAKQSQNNLAVIGVSIIVGTAVLISGASWLTNFYLTRRRIENLLEAKKIELSAKAEDIFNKSIENMKEETEKIRKETKEYVDKRMILADAEMARLHARDAQLEQQWEVAALWWARAIKGYIEGEELKLLRIAVEGVKSNLNKCSKPGSSESIDEIQKCASVIPATLWLEKNRIEKKIKELK